MSATVPIPGLLGDEEKQAPCDIYKTDVYGGGCITLYYFWALAFALLMVRVRVRARVRAFEGLGQPKALMVRVRGRAS